MYWFISFKSSVDVSSLSNQLLGIDIFNEFRCDWACFSKQAMRLILEKEGGQIDVLVNNAAAHTMLGAAEELFSEEIQA